MLDRVRECDRAEDRKGRGWSVTLRGERDRNTREVGVIYTRGEERGSEIEKEKRDMNPFLRSQERRGINDI
jgi:hypothetical protein